MIQLSIHNNLSRYLRDCFDHIIQIIDILEVYRDSSMGLIDIYLSGANNKMQEGKASQVENDKID